MTETPTPWERTIEAIQEAVRTANANAGAAYALNEATGQWEDTRIITFGYIGNLGRFGDDRRWTVWVKGWTPGRQPSAPTNAVPYFRTGDVAGAARALTFVQGFIAGQTTKPWRP
jgi:hypothetical protein